MKTCNYCIFGAWTYYIWFNGHIPDEYLPDAIKKNRLYQNHTIFILWWHTKLRYSPSSSFKIICNKPFHKIRQRTVGLPCLVTSCVSSWGNVLGLVHPSIHLSMSLNTLIAKPFDIWTLDIILMHHLIQGSKIETHQYQDWVRMFGCSDTMTLRTSIYPLRGNN